jgi:hypothetical protein
MLKFFSGLRGLYIPVWEYMSRRKKRKGDFSCEISPSLFRFSEIRFGFRITTLAFPESLGAHELTPARSSLFSDHCRRKNFLTGIHLQLPGTRVSLPILEDDALSALSSWKIALPLKAILLSANACARGLEQFSAVEMRLTKWKLAVTLAS